MSASREKKKRQNQPEVAAPVEVAKKGMSKGLKRTLAAVVAVILVVAIVFLAMVSAGFFEKHATVAVVNGHKLTPAMFNYFYRDAYTQLNSFGMMDTSTPLSQQPCGIDGFETWADYVMDFTANSTADVYAIYDEAVANGYLLDQDQMDSIDAQIEMMGLYATMYGYANADAMIAAQYGPGCNSDNYRVYLTVNTIANDYLADYQASLDYSADEIAAQYAENPENYDRVTFRYYGITPATIGQENDDAGMKACEMAAKNLAEAAQGNEQAFIDEITKLLPDETYDADSGTLRSAYKHANCADTYKDWVTDPARQEGDTTYLANGENGYVVLYFIRHDADYQMPNVRHILIAPDNTADEAKMAEAKEKAEAVLAEYEAGESGDEAFAALAKEYSADNGEAGGLYENIERGTMVESFEAWCYDESRQVGDTGIVETEYGYHVMYFSGYGRYYYTDYLVENDMEYEAIQAWRDEVTANATYSINDSAKRWVADI